MSRIRDFEQCIFKVLLLVSILFFNAGCSGGGASGNGNEVISYSGNREAANITAKNALQFLDLSYSVLFTVDTQDYRSRSGAKLDDDTHPFRMKSLVSTLKSQVKQVFPSKSFSGRRYSSKSVPHYDRTEVIDERIPCENSNGYNHYQGTAFVRKYGISDSIYEEIVGFDVDINVNSCLSDGDLLNGMISYFSDFNTSFEEFTFQPFSIQSVAGSFDISGSFTSEYDSTDNTIEKFNIILRNNMDGEMVQYLNYVHKIIPQNFSETFLSATEAFEGEIMHSIHGKVFVETISPFGYEHFPLQFPGKNGAIRISGQPGQYVQATFSDIISGGIVVDKAIDLQLVTSEEVSNHGLTFANFSNNPAYMGLYDGDDNGLPDAWEEYYGLSTNNIHDANLDSDGDRVSNLDEYISFTSPIDANDFPQITNLELEIHQSVSRYPVDIPQPLAVMVENLGPGATNGSVTLTLTYPSTLTANLPVWLQGKCQVVESQVVCATEWDHLGAGGKLLDKFFFTSDIIQTVNVSISVSGNDQPELNNVVGIYTQNITFDFFKHDGIFQDIVDASSTPSIVIPPGHYIGVLSNPLQNRFVPVTIPSKTTLRSLSGPSDTHLYGVEFTLHRGAEVSGFTMHAVNSMDINFSEFCTTGITCELSSYEFRFQNNRIFSNYSATEFEHHPSRDKFKFTRNLVENAITSSGGLFWPGFQSRSSVQINNNIFNNVDGGIFSDSGDFGLGYDETYSPSVEIRHNTFVNNNYSNSYSNPVYEFDDWSAGVSGRSASFSNRIIENNIFYGNPVVLEYSGYQESILSSFNSPQVGHNIFYGNDNDVINFEFDLSLGNNNLSSDPVFSDISSNDFAPMTGSPAIDAGSSGLIEDYDGNTRPVDGNQDGFPEVDIGAIEVSL